MILHSLNVFRLCLFLYIVVSSFIIIIVIFFYLFNSFGVLLLLFFVVVFIVYCWCFFGGFVCELIDSYIVLCKYFFIVGQCT